MFSVVGTVELFDEVSQQRACDLDGVGGAALGSGKTTEEVEDAALRSAMDFGTD